MSFTSKESFGEESFERIIKRFQEWVDKTLPENFEDATPEDVEKLAHWMESFAQEQFSSVSKAATSELKTSLDSALQELSNLNQAVEAWPETGGTLSASSIFDHLTKFFQNDDWSFTRLKGETSLRLAFAGNNGQWNCIAQAREQQQQAVFYSISPITAPQDRRLPMAEFLTRANYGLIIGNFELDFSDGEIRYKTSIDVEGDTLSQALIKQLVYTNVLTMDQYLPGIEAVIKHGMNAEAALTLVES